VTRLPAEALEASPVLRLARQALAADEPWIVGGTVRDMFLRRPLDDIDLVVRGDPRGAAAKLARESGGHAFELSEQFGAWRVIAPDRSWQADVTPVRDGTIEDDLALRDFTINAIAAPLGGEGLLTDPFGGVGDIEAGRLRAVGTRSFHDDPLRTMRMARLACELKFEVEGETLELAREAAARINEVAPERSYYELRKLVSSDDPLMGIGLMDDAGLLRALLPELDALKEVEQNPYHHLDVWGHTREVLRRLLDIEANPSAVFGPLGEPLAHELARPLADDMSRWQVLRLGALTHDIGKPGTRAVTDEGRVLFWGHDELGATMSRELCRRLRTSAIVGEFLALLARHHLRLGFLVHHRPLSRRDVYRYLRVCEPVEVEVTVLSVADRLATRGQRTREEAVESHLEIARDIASEALAWRTAGPPEPPVRGDELISALGIAPGPEVGRLLEAVREATFAGEVRSRGDALALARARLDETS
jgi:putative nucleotidyltransferase with HDIG domain